MNAQHGFTLVEIAIALVCVGLLLGGIIRAQEIISSAQVRRITESVIGTQTAFYGFRNRYLAVPGDWSFVAATQAIGVTIIDGGNANGIIDNGTPPGDADWTEPNAMWVQLAAAGFIDGSYAGGSSAPTTDNKVAPLNAFNHVMSMGRTRDSLNELSSVSRLSIFTGRGIPVAVMRAVDLKMDDGFPASGELRATVVSNALFGPIAEQDANCVDLIQVPAIWNVRLDAQDCNAVYRF